MAAAAIVFSFWLVTQLMLVACLMLCSVMCGYVCLCLIFMHGVAACMLAWVSCVCDVAALCAGGYRPPFNLPMAHMLLLP